MNVSKVIFPKRTKEERETEGDTMEGIGRALRSFDVETIAPYDHKGLVAFLKAGKLTELTSGQIRVFLLLREHPGPKGYTEAFIARWLEMTPNTVRSCLRALKRQGFALHSSVEQRDDQGQPVVAWICNPANPWADEDQLFWEFAKLV